MPSLRTDKAQRGLPENMLSNGVAQVVSFAVRHAGRPFAWAVFRFLIASGELVLTLHDWGRWAAHALRPLIDPRTAKKKVQPCTSPHGLIDVLPPELVIHVLSASEMGARDLACCALVCTAFDRAISDPVNDSRLWEACCRRRWEAMAYDPAMLHAHRFKHAPELSTHRARYMWAELDGARRCGTAGDLWSVEVWELQYGGGRPYHIGSFPYRREGDYVSPTFANVPRPFRVRVRKDAVFSEAAYVNVEGIPPVRMVRRSDWGWDLRNPLWVASSVKHSVQRTGGLG